MGLQPKTEPGSPPILASSSNHGSLNEMSISELFSGLRTNCDKAEEVLLARDAKHKAEIGSLVVKYELEMLQRLHTKDQLKKKEQQYQNLERKWLDDNDAIAALRIRCSELEDENKKNLETIQKLKDENYRLEKEKINEDARVSNEMAVPDSPPFKRKKGVGHCIGESDGAAFFYPSCFHFCSSSRMSDRGKGKAKVTPRKRKQSQSSTTSAISGYAKISLSDKEKADQLLPPVDGTRFPNLYCELRFPVFQKRHLNLEKKLSIPPDLRQSIESRIEGLGLSFVDRELVRVNESWVQEFYCNFFRPTLDSIHLRGGQILMMEADIEDALHCQPKASDKDAYHRAEEEIHCLTFDYDALRSVIALPDAPWVLDAGKTKPKGMLFDYLTREAKTWQQILAHYVMPTTHFTEIPIDMLVLVGCIMEGKELYFPRLIKRFMWRAHVRGTLPFPTLVTEMAQRAGIPWLPEDESPPTVHGKERFIPWGTWVSDKPPAPRRARASAAATPGLPSSSAAAGPSTTPAAPIGPAPPPPAPQPTYLLVQHLIRLMERRERRILRRCNGVSQMLVSLGAEMPPDSDTSSAEEEEQT
ncbi:uncharacterized protein LOC107638263 isoform X2 [Arachis ipaensis]|uniref:Putative plant transposon protein domain-containing protein n=1 Tax=Arachis hypogaea TaxID=3818 RepID=A0A444ZBK4_ARAHY|nr:uncharacterized protein LOC107638263 isoform X2 [Arachis ipaensis]XP_029147763.1 uncharacterized protein LOC112740545 isoform X2 [Arachis hypogaea]QHO05697.1 uncharacterized protein DS421_14g448330 [Arachis hypogaea]RYR11573.1 hypothetical protein Ahy_B04g069081 [Arachis hypogaea]